MLFQFHSTFTENDYLDFNYFNTFRVKHGRQQVQARQRSTTFTVLMIMFSVYMVAGWTFRSAAYIITLALICLINILLTKWQLKRSIQKQIQKIKVAGPLPFDPESDYEFYEDRFVEITKDSRIEQSYSLLNLVAIDENRFIYLYDKTGCCCISIPLLKMQIDADAFINFITQKCTNVERYTM